ncbi:MAG: acyP [Acidimicrobiaceae bacterium]|nr:acyP [Acidimicrobiaceae bacterium]
MRQSGSGTVRLHVYVSGRVQGVWFRESCRRTAARRDLAGWVRNLSDGRVEAVFEGDAPAAKELVDWCRHGSSSAEVEQVVVIEEPPEGIEGFVVR